MRKQLPQSDLSIASLCGLAVIWTILTWTASKVLSRILVSLVLKGSTWDD